MKKIAIILWGNIWYCPFINIYIKVLEEQNVSFDLISWNRDGNDEKKGIQYQEKQDLTVNGWKKLFSFYRYSRFINNQVKKNKYEKLIVFNPQAAIFLLPMLLKRFKNNYIFDFRDLSIEQSPIFKIPFRSVLKYSYVNVISSPGFKQFLPKDFEYMLSHNFDIDVVKDSILNPRKFEAHKNKINVLTIGGIRDYDSNIQVIDALSNNEAYNMKFVGRGPSAEDLQRYACDKDVHNISFVGYYPKTDEHNYIKDSTFMNIFYPRKKSHDTALSNRFYSSLIFRKPMITTINTIQGDYCLNYSLGIAVDNCKDLSNNLISFLNDIKPSEYEENCNKLLLQFLDDYDRWKSKLLEFIR